MSTLLCSAAGAVLVVTSKTKLLFTHNLFLSLCLSPALNFPSVSLPHFLSQAGENFLLNTRWCAWESLFCWSLSPYPKFL